MSTPTPTPSPNPQASPNRGRIVFEINDKINPSISGISTALGVSEAQMKNAIDSAIRNKGTVTLKANGILRISANGAVTNAQISAFKIVKNAGRLFMVADVASSSVALVDGVINNNPGKATANAIKIGVSVLAATAGPKGWIIGLGVYLFDNVGMSNGQSRIEQMTTAAFNSTPSSNSQPTPRPSPARSPRPR
jgi:hypothetical protein